MQATMKDLMKEARELERCISDMNDVSGYLKCEDLSMMDLDYNNPNELQMVKVMRHMMEKLDEIKSDLEYYRAPIETEGKLYMNGNGRYQLNGQEFHCGDCLEVKVYNDLWERCEWVTTRIEHNGKKWYLVGCSGVKIDGLPARIR